MSSINGGESDLRDNCGICGTPRQVRDNKPEMSENLELCTKWSLLNDKLLLTAAAFQVTKDDVMENMGDDYETLGTLNTGKNRVRGFEFSVVGNVTDDLNSIVAAAIMESEVRDSGEPRQRRGSNCIASRPGADVGSAPPHRSRGI